MSSELTFLIRICLSQLLYPSVRAFIHELAKSPMHCSFYSHNIVPLKGFISLQLLLEFDDFTPHSTSLKLQSSRVME